MKCPVCQAKLLPVDGEMFCLQCGQSVHQPGAADNDSFRLEDTVDPMLQRAIRDAGNYTTQFKSVAAEPEPAKNRVTTEPAQEAEPEEAVAKTVMRRRRSFVSLHAIIMEPRGLTPAGMLMAGGSAAAAAAQRTMASALPRRPASGLGKQTGAGRWLVGLAMVAVFVGLNLGLGKYYADKVYPGVRLGTVGVGGLSLNELNASLPALMEQPGLVASVDGRQIPLNVGDGAQVNLASVKNQVESLGRQSILPLAGVIQSWVAAPVQPNYSLSDDTVARLVDQLSVSLNRPASDAFATTYGGQALVIADKPGAVLDKTAAAAAIRAAYGTATVVSLSLGRVAPKVAAVDLQADKAAADAIIAQPVSLTVGQAHYTPSASQVASWIVFKGPGQGVTIDAAGPVSYVAGIPGKFDRQAAVAGLTSALMNHQGAVNASTRHATANPTPVSSAISGPRATYNYCTQADLSHSQAFSAAVSATLGSGGGWTLGNRINFVLAQNNCNFTLQLTDTAGMAQLNSICAAQTTCRIHNDLGINLANWSNPPASWKAGVPAYQMELINQVVGQWLDFEHAGCSQASAASSPVAEPTVNVPGCSPNWHPVPAELQDTKILPGF